MQNMQWLMKKKNNESKKVSDDSIPKIKEMKTFWKYFPSVNSENNFKP